METENRSILILFSVFVLLIFLDHQSANQLNRPLAGVEKVRAGDLLRGNSPIDSPINSAIEDRPAIERPNAASHSDGTSSESAVSEAPLDEAAEQAARTARETEDVAREAAERVPGKARTLVEGAIDRAKQTVLDKSPLQRKLKLKEVSLSAGEDRHALPLLPTRRLNGQDVTPLDLYFPAFQGRQTMMVRVRRSVPGPVDPWAALRMLQKGPSNKEKGLVNAVDSSLPLEGFEIQDGVGVIRAGSGIHRMSQPILQDRVDQICLTLGQFKEIRSLRFVVDGKAVQRIGSGKDLVEIPVRLRMEGRKVQDFTSARE